METDEDFKKKLEESNISDIKVSLHIKRITRCHGYRGLAFFGRGSVYLFSVFVHQLFAVDRIFIQVRKMSPGRQKSMSPGFYFFYLPISYIYDWGEPKKYQQIFYS